MNYYKYMEHRALDMRYLRFRLQKLFSVLNDRDYDRLQSLLTEAENILRGYFEVGEHGNG